MNDSRSAMFSFVNRYSSRFRVNDHAPQLWKFAPETILHFLCDIVHFRDRHVSVDQQVKGEVDLAIHPVQLDILTAARVFQLSSNCFDLLDV